VLRAAGLVRGEPDPPRVCYCAEPEALRRLRDRLEEMLQEPRKEN